jgi:hypothetical protein
MIIYGEDGVTHINVYSKGKTQIGRWLSNFALSPIDIPGDGSFKCVEGYWYWLLTDEERFRKFNGPTAKKFGKLAECKPREEIEDFEDKIKKALDIKLKTYLDKSKILCESDLPLCHYYDYDGERIDVGYDWIIDHIEERRILLREFFNKR